MATFRRDRLRRLVEAGKVEMFSAYHFDDMLGAERTVQVMPVAMMPEDRTTCKGRDVLRLRIRL